MAAITKFMTEVTLFMTITLHTSHIVLKAHLTPGLKIHLEALFTKFQVHKKLSERTNRSIWTIIEPQYKITNLERVVNNNHGNVIDYQILNRGPSL